LVDVSRTLGISPSAADRLIRVKVNDNVHEGTEIAIGKGMMPHTIRAPRNGRVVAVGGGQVLMETGDSSIHLRAGIPGTIVQIIPNRGAIIRGVGALIQGTWGNGRTETGALYNLTEGPADVLTASRLDVSLRGSIILAGIIRDAETLRQAAELPVRGLILSSISPGLLSAAQQLRFPIISIDGFGQIPMNSAAYKLLSTSVKRDVTINAEAFSRHTGTRPEIIIPVAHSQEPPQSADVSTLETGQTVRMRRAPHAGEIGILTKLRPGLSSLPSGLRAPAGDVKLENGEQILVPLVNLEIVG